MKPIIAVDLSTIGRGGGPYVNTMRLIESQLSLNYNFKIIVYKPELGRGISLLRILDLYKQIKKINPDIVHFAGLQISGFEIATACLLANIKKSVLTIHGSSSEALDISLFKKIILSYLIEPMTLLFVKNFYGVSKYVTNMTICKLYFYKSLGHIYNFLPESKNIVEEKLEIRDEFLISKTDIIAVTVSRITRDKGINVLADSILKLQAVPRLKFLIIGDGEFLNKLKVKLNSLINSNVVYVLGYRVDVQKILKESDIFILPTLHETLSIALLEASIEKLPLIATNTGGIPEIVIDGYNGLLINPNDSQDLSEAILKLYNSKKLRCEYGENAKKNVIEKFSNIQIVNQISALYFNLLHK